MPTHEHANITRQCYRQHHPDQQHHRSQEICEMASRAPDRPDNCSRSSNIFLKWSLLIQVVISTALLSRPVSGLLPEFLTYKTCADAPPGFSGCMTNVTADLGERVVLNCQVDPRCVIQYFHWYHEPREGEKVLIKTGRSANDPYVHTINGVEDHHFGRYFCVIANVAGKTECSAFLTIRSLATSCHGDLALVLISFVALNKLVWG